MKKILTLIYICCFSLITSGMYATVKLPAIFSDNMVIQSNKPIKVWGWADKNEQIEVRFHGQVKKVKADKNGNWNVLLNAVPHGGPYMLDIKGKSNSVTLRNVLVGEVWLCSGQSNMEWTVINAQDANTEITNADYPNIRSFNVVKATSLSPKDDVEGIWEVCSSSTVANFSAVAYFFARMLYQELNIPIGIINSSWGGTDIETWTSSDSFNKLDNKFKERYKDFRVDNFETYARDNEKNKLAYEHALKNDPGMAEQWFSPTYNSSSWSKMQIPQLWENVLGEVDGIIWFKYSIDLPQDADGKTAVMNLGAIDDDDVVWINGTKIGETQGFNKTRKYNVPENVLKAGTNTITVKVLDTGGGGGIYGKPEDVYLETTGKKYNLAGEWQYKEAATNKQFGYINMSPNMYYSLLYNGMINPLIQFGIRGAIWYQGENNAGQAYNYRTLFPNMINDWRTKWGYEFPFYWVQLANYMAKDDTPRDSDWAELREAQTMTLSLPQTGEAVITDIGEAFDIHPRNKQDVGIRLALNALNKDYGMKNIEYSGPRYKSMEIEGNKAIINFNHADNGLVIKNKYGYIEGFAVAGNDKKFYWAKAYIDGNKIVVSSENVKSPVAVRYSWSNNPDVNLYNAEGLPAAPFRTDDWRGITQRD